MASGVPRIGVGARRLIFLLLSLTWFLPSCSPAWLLQTWNIMWQKPGWRNSWHPLRGGPGAAGTPFRPLNPCSLGARRQRGAFPAGVRQRLTELVALEPWWCGLARRHGGGALPGDPIGQHLPIPLNPGLVRAVNCLMHILALSPGTSAPEAAAAALERICTSCWSLFWACCLPLKYARESAFSTSRLSVGGPHLALLFWDLECL